MKIFLYPILLTSILIYCCTRSDLNSKKFTLKGEVLGHDSCIMVLTYRTDKSIIYDTVKVKNGEFVFAGNIFEPTSATLSWENDLKRVFIYLEPRKMKISLSTDNYQEFRMIGSKTQYDLDILNELEYPFHIEISRLREQLKEINGNIKISANDSVKEILSKNKENLFDQISKARKRIYSTQIEFIMKNPGSYLSSEYLYVLEGNNILSPDSVKLLFSGLKSHVKKSTYGKLIIDVLRKKENILIGREAPEFKAMDLNNQPIMLSQFKGESVVLLDFWASYCIPCRESLPSLKKIYNKYHSRGFEIIAISLDLNRKPWIEAVKQDSIDIWYNILLSDKFAEGVISNYDISQNYFVPSIPFQILIDRNGKILGSFNDLSEKSDKLLTQLLFQIYEN